MSENSTTVKPKKEKSYGKSANVYKYVKRRNKEDKTMLFQVLPSARTRGSVHKLESIKVCLSIALSLIVRVTEHWHR